MAEASRRVVVITQAQRLSSSSQVTTSPSALGSWTEESHKVDVVEYKSVMVQWRR